MKSNNSTDSVPSLSRLPPWTPTRRNMPKSCPFSERMPSGFCLYSCHIRRDADDPCRVVDTDDHCRTVNFCVPHEDEVRQLARKSETPDVVPSGANAGSSCSLHRSPRGGLTLADLCSPERPHGGMAGAEGGSLGQSLREHEVHFKSSPK